MEFEEFKKLENFKNMYWNLKNELLKCVDYSNKDLPITINIGELRKIALNQLDFTVEDNEVIIDV